MLNWDNILHLGRDNKVNKTRKQCKIFTEIQKTSKYHLMIIEIG